MHVDYALQIIVSTRGLSLANHERNVHRCSHISDKPGRDTTYRPGAILRVLGKADLSQPQHHSTNADRNDTAVVRSVFSIVSGETHLRDGHKPKVDGRL